VFRFLLLINNLQASGINVHLPHALDCALNAHTIRIIIFRFRSNIVAEKVSIAVLVQVSLKLLASFRAIFIAIMII